MLSIKVEFLSTPYKETGHEIRVFWAKIPRMSFNVQKWMLGKDCISFEGNNINFSYFKGNNINFSYF